MDETKFYIELEEKFRFVKREGVSYPQAAFSHLVSGYGAGYYAYIW
jgi:Zn-dependent oligopeptidase